MHQRRSHLCIVKMKTTKTKQIVSWFFSTLSIHISFVSVLRSFSATWKLEIQAQKPHDTLIFHPLSFDAQSTASETRTRTRGENHKK